MASLSIGLHFFIIFHCFFSLLFWQTRLILLHPKQLVYICSVLSINCGRAPHSLPPLYLNLYTKDTVGINNDGNFWYLNELRCKLCIIENESRLFPFFLSMTNNYGILIEKKKKVVKGYQFYRNVKAMPFSVHLTAYLLEHKSRAVDARFIYIIIIFLLTKCISMEILWIVKLCSC